MELHRLLVRQMRRFNMQYDKTPLDIKDWQDFLNAINTTYDELDQERYLLQRSMNISSREMLSLNEKRRKNEAEILSLHEQLLTLVGTTGDEDTSVLHKRLLRMAREAGMADVATSILHNVGNILSSTNTSLNLLDENISQPYYEKCFSLLKLIKENESDLSNYLTSDPKGRLIPRYLAALVEIFESDHQSALREISNLKGYIQHIRDIVSKQQTLTGMSGFTEKLNITEIIDVALQITGLPEKKAITVNKLYNAIPAVTVDRAKVMQILVNLMNNAKDAVMTNTESSQKKIDIVLQLLNSEQLALSVTDNGIGVAPEDLVKIFSFGYTNKRHGHGFGLHNSALIASEMGGKLMVKSDGINCGTSFTLILPLTSPSIEVENK